MSQTDFAVEKPSSCPLSQIPPHVWLSILRPPFRKRHPFIFWLAILAVLLLCVWLGHALGRDSKTTGERIALVSIQGPIMDAGDTLAWLRKIERNDSVKGILCRVNSPGGGAAASQEIYAALARIGQSRPVVISMGATAASGGLMISMAGKRIFANPSTVTGSIGVRMDIPQLQDLMRKIGIGQETLVTAPYKDAASYTHPLTAQDRAYLESVLLNMHEQFVGIVAKGRDMPLAKANELANGKIYTGQEALKLGLIDEIGGQDEALAWICGQTGVSPDKELLVRPKGRDRLTEIIFGVLRLAGIQTDSVAGLLNGQFSQPLFLYQF